MRLMTCVDCGDVFKPYKKADLDQLPRFARNRCPRCGWKHGEVMRRAIEHHLSIGNVKAAKDLHLELYGRYLPNVG